MIALTQKHAHRVEIVAHMHIQALIHIAGPYNTHHTNKRNTFHTQDSQHPETPTHTLDTHVTRPQAQVAQYTHTSTL